MHLARLAGLTGSWCYMPRAWRDAAGAPFMQRCTSLGQVLQAESMSTVHFLSVHVGGGGVAVLRIIDWQRVSVRVVHADVAMDREGDLTDLMKRHGFARFARTMSREHGALFAGCTYARTPVVVAERGIGTTNGTAICSQCRVMNRSLSGHVEDPRAYERKMRWTASKSHVYRVPTCG